MIGKQLQNYKIEKIIGEGGMAFVYLATNVNLGSKVAIKLLKEDFVGHPNIRKRFLSEAKNLAQMNHPNVIRVVDLIDAGDIVAFVMEYVEGNTLEEHLGREGKLADQVISSFLHQMILAIEYVHKQGFIHRDIKPSNFLITNENQIKLLDFGIAKNTNDVNVDYTKTGLAQQMGTPLYMSPEQIKNTSEVTKQTDFYSLGVVLWEMIMGKKPYDSKSFSLPEIQVSILKEVLPFTNSKWDKIIQKATQKEETKRFQCGEEFLLAFDINDVIEMDFEKTVIVNKDFLSNPMEKKRITYFNFKTISIVMGILLSVGILIILSSSNLKIGQKHQGGIIFYLDNSGKHGKVCMDGALGLFDWDSAMEECQNLNLNGYADWYLPTKNDLNLLYNQRHVIPVLNYVYYWSSSEYDTTYAFHFSFYSGYANYGIKKNTHAVHAIRAF